jgi:hypothetical protein
MKYPPVSLERMAEAVNAVHERLARVVGALEANGVPYAVIGGNAVAAWVTRIDTAAVRYNQDIDVLLRRDDFPRATDALEKVGFVLGQGCGVGVFLDGPASHPRDAVHVVFAGEMVRSDDIEAAPDVSEIDSDGSCCVLPLESLLRMSLTANKRNDCVDVRDLIDIGLIDATWLDRLSPELAVRLQHLLDTPDG